MSREEIALRMFCAMLSRPDNRVGLYPHLGEDQIKVAFLLADTFTVVAQTYSSASPNPSVSAPVGQTFTAGIEGSRP